MRILFIGGTGTISSAITQQLAATEHELWLLNRGNRKAEVPANVKQIVADINDEEAVLKQIGDMQFDSVCDFIGFVPAQVERDYRLFAGRTRQYVYISSASAYNKPARNYIINEGTTLANPHWQYSRDKIACEELLISPKEYDLEGNLTGDKAVTVVFDCSKLKRVVPEFQATVRFEEGVRRCVKYILAHPELQQEEPEFDAWCDRVIQALEEAKTKI